MPNFSFFPVKPLRDQLLDRVRQEVKDAQSHSLNLAVLTNFTPQTESSLDETESAVSSKGQRIWELEVKMGNLPSKVMAADTDILTLFQQMRGRLLILGAVGGGKTTTLIELAEKLIESAQSDSNQPIPVLFNMVSWDENQVNMQSWLIEQLAQKYHIPAPIGKVWLEQQQIIPLLDGLDELSPNQHQAGIKAINQLITKGENAPKYMIVACSFNAYKKCQVRLKLNGAILLRPLNEAQIKKYLISARSRELWYAIENESSLLQLAQIPLLLSMMTLAYEEILIIAWSRLNSTLAKRDYLLNAYIRSQLVRDIKSKYYQKRQEPKPEKIRHWLTWLAQRMEVEKLGDFTVKEIQPSWLVNEVRLRQYEVRLRLFSSLIWAIFLGLISGVIFGIIGQPIIGLILAIFGGILGGFYLKISGLERLILHFMLWLNGDIPWNYSRFLNYCAERLLLQKTGERYSFIHKLLQQHFARM